MFDGNAIKARKWWGMTLEALYRFSKSSVPVYGMSILLVVMGTFLGMKKTQLGLSNSFPWSCAKGLNVGCLSIHADAYSFIVAFCVFSALFLAREIAIGKTLKQERIDLYKAISHSPSPQLMEKFAEVYDLLTRAASKVETSKQDVLDREIVLGLGGLIALLKAYQPSWSGTNSARIVASIMIYKPIAEIAEARRPAMLDALKPFLFNPGTFTGLAGVLEVIPSFSLVEFDENAVGIDEDLAPLVLPIPENRASPHNRNLSRILLGSPTAYLEKSTNINDTHGLRQIYQDRSKYDIPNSVIENEHRFFTETEQGKLVRSIFSIRFGEEGAGSVSGVLNFHCDKVGLFLNDHLTSNFIALSKPIVHRLEELLNKRLKVSQEELAIGQPLTTQGEEPAP
jgi:hypothetical protein